MYEYEARVVRVIDGDTIVLAVDLGFRLTATYKFRIQELDTPEVYGVKKGSAEYEKGIVASNYAKELLPKGKKVALKSATDPGIYGRYSATIYLHDQGFLISFATLMKKAGHHKEKKEKGKEE